MKSSTSSFFQAKKTSNAFENITKEQHQLYASACVKVEQFMMKANTNAQKIELSLSITNSFNSLDKSISILLQKYSGTQKIIEYRELLKQEVNQLARYIKMQMPKETIDTNLIPILSTVNALGTTIFLEPPTDTSSLTTSP